MKFVQKKPKKNIIIKNVHIVDIRILDNNKMNSIINFVITILEINLIVNNNIEFHNYNNN